MDFMKNISVSDVPGNFFYNDSILILIHFIIHTFNIGIGKTLGHKLSTLGVSNCGELSALSLQTLKSEFGNKTGLSLFK